jgi:hypothetical protein
MLGKVSFTAIGLVVVVFVIRASRRRTLVSTARVNILRLILRRRWRSREKYIVAGPAQLRSAGSEASGNAIRVRYVGPAEPKHIRCAGLTLLLRPLSGRRSLRREKKYKCCDTASYLFKQHIAHNLGQLI